MGLKLANGTRARLGCQAKAAMLLLATLTLAACNGPPDQPLVTSGTQDEYRASLDPLLPKMSKHELEAFDWAVSDFDLTKLHSKYPGASPRKIIRSEVREVLDTYPERVKALEAVSYTHLDVYKRQSQCLSRSSVHQRSHMIQVLLTGLRKIHAFGQELTQQAIGVLVAAALPGLSLIHI